MPAQTYHVIGLLSGSSLDGTDLAWLKFDVDLQNPKILVDWSILDAKTIAYSKSWADRLRALPLASARDLIIADTELGHYYGALINTFIQGVSYDGKPDLISSHGHTIFHFPHLKSTTQIGDGAAIVSETAIDTVTQLRSVDVAFGAQGAPLAPLGDRYLYPGYTYYLNLGGIANITTLLDGKLVAFDICTCNQIFNGLARLMGKEYDHNGEIASSGLVNPILFDILSQDPYLNLPFPKSLDNTWSQVHQVTPSIQFEDSIENKMCTGVEFVARELDRACNSLLPNKKEIKKTIFVTGGGAFNTYLITRMKYHCPDIEFILPSKQIIEFKEVSFIGLAGLWRLLNLPNLFASVTGAPKDTVNGALYVSGPQTR
ncbi:MAG: anhydro-N-acetylmuramic acid kinase [Saprospiraceae bacterium]